MSDPNTIPDPDGQNPPRPIERPVDSRPGQDIPELPGRGDTLGNDVKDGPDGLDIGPS